MSDERPLVEVTDTRINYRASGLGQCLRALTAARLGYVATPPPKKLQEAFQRGHALEAAILKRLENQGWKIEPDSFQAEVELHVGTLESGQKLYIVGHVDCLATHPDGHHFIPVDAKAFSQSTMDDWNRQGIEGFPHYSWQQSAYAIGFGVDSYCLALYNQEDGTLTPYIGEPEYDYEDLAFRVYHVESLAEANDISNVACSARWGCPFSYLHDEKPTDDIPAAAQQLVANYKAAADKEKAWKKIRSTLADLIIGQLPYDEDLRTFTGQGLTVTVVSNSRRLDIKKVAQLFREANLSIDDYYIPGEGVHIQVKEKPDGSDQQGSVQHTGSHQGT